jgi:hypothetical protein
VVLQKPADAPFLFMEYTMNDKVIMDALMEIASYQRGGVIKMGTPEYDRDAMIGTAREALRLTGHRYMNNGWVLIDMKKDS